MFIKKKIIKSAEFIRDHAITPSPRERFYGIRDTVLGWAITALTFTLFETPGNLILAEISFLIKFITGLLFIFLYIAFESIATGNKLNGFSSLRIKDYTETATLGIHLNARQRFIYIYIRGAISVGSYIALNFSKDLFGVIDNSAIFGADALVYAVLASFVFLQKINKKEKFGIGIAILGILFILFFDLRDLSWGQGLTSAISGAVSATLFCIIFFISSVIVRHDTPIRITLHQCVIGGILSLAALIITISAQSFNGDFAFPVIPIDVVKESIIIGVLYTISVILFLKAFLHTESVIIAMLGYSLGIFAFIFEAFFKSTFSDYKNLIGSGLITLGCSFLIYEEYVRNMFESKKFKYLKPIYQKGLKYDLLEIEDQFRDGKIGKYEYLSEKHEFNKILLEYTNLISGSIINKIEILPNTLLFKFSPNTYLEADGGARSAPFEILNFGSYEPEDEEMSYKIINDGDAIFDIGAHIGWYTINFAQRFPRSKIYAFEPIKYTYDFLISNIERNNLKNVSAFNFGIGKKDETKELYYFRGGSAIASIENLISFQNAKKIKCSLKSLDNLFEELKCASLDFIKCDIEGAELNMLIGGQRTIEKFLPIILIELYEEWCKKCGYSSYDVIRLLDGLGYSIYQAISGRLRLFDNSIASNLDRYNYFFLHKIKHAKIIETMQLN